MAAATAAPARTITSEEQATAHGLLARARTAMQAVETYDQAAVDRLCRAIAWAGGNEETATRLAKMSVDESGMGSPKPKRRAKVLGILRDALRQKSMGIIEEIPEKGIVKYAKPAGVIASLIPVTSPYITPIGIAIYAIKCKDAVIFSPHPGSRKTTNETVRVMRAALRKLGASEDVLQCVERPSIPLANELMRLCDLTIATGGPAMVSAAYSSGKPAYGVGSGNATMVIDETADLAGFAIPDDKTFLVVEEQQIGRQHRFSTEKLGPVLAIFKYDGFDQALDKVRQIFDTGGKGHPCGIYSHSDDHIHRLALMAPVSRIMVRQVQSSSNAGTFTDGMPMTSSMGCGVWGGNITNENISLNHYMNVTWVSRPIPEDRPSEQELFGEFW